MTDPTHPASNRPVLAPRPERGADPKLAGAVREFEAFVVGRLLQSAFASDAGLLGAPHAGAGPFGDMFYQALGRSIARAGGVGLADALLAALATGGEGR